MDIPDECKSAVFVNRVKINLRQIKVGNRNVQRYRE